MDQLICFAASYQFQTQVLSHRFSSQIRWFVTARGIFCSEMRRVLLNLLSMTAVQLTEWDLIGDVSMLSIKFATTIAAVLFMSAGAAQAGGRPFVVTEMDSLPATSLAMPIEGDGQVKHHIVRPGSIASGRLASRHRPVSMPCPTGFAAMTAERPKRTNPVGSRSKFTAALIARRFEKALAAGDIRFADRLFTSSISRAPRTVIPTSSLDFCIGSIAPCGAVRFAQNQAVTTPSIWIRHYISH
jgi:hypothetical protein